MNFSGLPTIKETIKIFGLSANKKLGQNFLTDSDITDQIALKAGVKGKHVLEVGPGPGGLTRSLLAMGAAQVTAIEKDERCADVLAGIKAIAKEKFTLIQGDALKFDESSLITDAKRLSVVANLPYNIGTQLVLKWLTNLDTFESITIMLQKEVIERLAAAPGEKAYGSLAIMTQLLCEPRILMTLEPEYFSPPPKVTSMVIKLTPREKPLYEVSLKKLERVTKTAFSQRRKTIRKSLQSLLGEHTEALLAKVGIDPQARPEVVSIKQFIDLTNAVELNS
jgi:16S rRNA (adenine1518-N6/adenine1519-N6)-dimethyltransferase